MKQILLVLLLFLTSATNFVHGQMVENSETPEKYGLKYVHASVNAEGNATIDVWKIIPEQSNGYTIILSYGDAGNKSHWLNQAAMCTQLGFEVVLYDYRGFGKSSPFQSKVSVLYYNAYGQDLKAVYDWTKLQNKKNKIVCWSMSMGTIITTFAIDELKIKPDLLVYDGLVFDVEATRDRFELIAPSDVHLMKQRIKKLNIPTLIFAGMQDMQTPVSEAQSFVDQKPKKRKLVTYNGGHLEGFHLMTRSWYGDLYLTEMINFINKKGNN